MAELRRYFFIPLPTGPAEAGNIGGGFNGRVVTFYCLDLSNLTATRDFALFRRLQPYNAVGHAIGPSTAR